MAGTLKVDTLNADSNLALKIANTAVAYIDSTGLKMSGSNLQFSSGGTLAVAANGAISTATVIGANLVTASGTTALGISANGQITTANAGFVLTGGQIQFPATQIASADGNCLDDYEEGTFTLTDASGAGLTLTTSFANYVKVGKQVTIIFQGSFPSTANTNSIQVGGLPFTSSTYSSGVFGYNDSASADRSFLIQSGVSYFQIRNPSANRTNANYSTSGFIGMATYFI